MRILFFIIPIWIVNLSAYQKADTLVSKAKFDSLCTKADAVILSDKSIVTVEDLDEMEVIIKKRILINNADGERFCNVRLSESEFSEVSEIKATITDTAGTNLRELQDDEIENLNFTPGYQLYSDETYKWFSLTHHTYPYIIEYSYRYEFESLFFWRSWYPQSTIPVARSSYKLILKDDLKYYTHSIGLNLNPSRSKVNGDSIIIWQAINLPPVKIENNIPPENLVQNAVIFSPDRFELENFEGPFSSWNAIAGWYKLLAENKYYLSEETKNEIGKLISTKEDKKEIIRTLYKYMQEKTRYIAIFLGIGGWQPHSADAIFKNRYGDCKDLSTLMISMLDVAGIKAYPALALTRDAGIVNPDFPSNQFNHCIAFVPLAKDTVWLECTTDFIDMEDIPYNIEGTHALVVKENGGELVKVPQKTAAKNLWLSTIGGTLDRRGNLSFTSTIMTTGNQKNFYRISFGFNKPSKIKQMITELLTEHIPGLTIASHTVEETELAQNPYKIEVIGKFKSFGKIVGKRIFFNPVVFNRVLTADIPKEEKREFPVFLKYPYKDIDSVAIRLPLGYKLELAPKQVQVLADFAKFETSYKIENSIFYFKRMIEYSSKLIQPSHYKEYINFIKKVVKSDQSKFVFKKG
jgi:Domain of Unknown Function with PDB structure (DUF3857)/Transglutaminase-like superfamily